MRFPDDLVNWAGHREGGVRRLFDKGSGRPSGQLIRTGLLLQLEQWAADFAASKSSLPNVILLVGGPGNGKTEAVESCIRRIDELASLGGELVREIEKQFASGTGLPMPRLVDVDLEKISAGKFSLHLAVVQDASVTDGGQKNRSPAQLFLSDIEKYADGISTAIYIACVNRGIIDEALAEAADQQREPARKLLGSVIRAAGLASDAPSAWPLQGYDHVAVWPMDIESLLTPVSSEHGSPAAQLLDIATALSDWPLEGECPAGENCPFCYSRKVLGGEATKAQLLKILRWYELASGKRWNFRDLGSLISYLLTNSSSSAEDSLGPCQWASRLVEIATSPTMRTKREGQEAYFLLVSAIYHHSLFGVWPRSVARTLRRDVRALGLENNDVLMGFYHFLSGRRRKSIPSTIEPQLSSISDFLDPALADPDDNIQLTSKTTISLRDIDARFSQSVSEGLTFIRRYHVLSPIEIELLSRLAGADRTLSEPMIRNKRPASATRVQIQIRDFASRLVRRAIGVRIGIARDGDVLERFQRLTDGDPALMHEVSKEVEKLLNDGERFTVSLTTTFGEPLPPVTRRAMLTTGKQRVRVLTNSSVGRPPSALRFLRVGDGASSQPVPLTYELFKSVQELAQGMLSAVLPRTVVALLDTTRARLSGQIVRDADLLDGAEIRIGTRNDIVGFELGQFVVRQRTQS